jgi:hypothetical protein
VRSFHVIRTAGNETGSSAISNFGLALYLSGEEPKVLIMTHFGGEPGRDSDCEKVMMECPLGVEEVTQRPHEAQTLFGGRV